MVVEEYESWLKREMEFNSIMGTFDSGSIIIRISNSHSICSSAFLEGNLRVDGYKDASRNQISPIVTMSPSYTTANRCNPPPQELLLIKALNQRACLQKLSIKADSKQAQSVVDSH